MDVFHLVKCRSILNYNIFRFLNLKIILKINSNLIKPSYEYLFKLNKFIQKNYFLIFIELVLNL